MWTAVMTALLLAQTVPDAEAEALGRRVAETGALSAILPMMLAKDTEELVAEHPELSDADKAALRATAADTGTAARERLFAAMGHGYAAALSVEDLRALVAFNESDAAKHWHAAEPGAVMGAMGVLGGFDFKEEVRKAMCAKAGKLCGE